MILVSKLRDIMRRSSARDGFKTRVISDFLYITARIVVGTCRLTVKGKEKVEAVRSQYGGVILATWHGRTFIPVVYYRKRGYWAFISTSRDGNYQNQVFRMLGWNTVRGSTSARGAVASALRMAKELKNGAVLAHTPDGPRGPSHVVHPGAIFLAEKSGCPILPAGVSAFPAMYMGAWDKFQVPKLFSKGAIIFGDPIFVPPDLDEDGRHALCLRLGDEINRLEAEADAFVRSKPSTVAAATRTDLS